jgi:chitosanase
MNLTAKQKRILEQVLNVFETGSAKGDYSAIAKFHDGPHGMKQITYGRSQTTEFGNLVELVEMYVNAKGTFSDSLRPYLSQIGHVSLVKDDNFQQLLKDAGEQDPLMRDCQDKFFDQRYFQPAMKWATEKGFKLPLSALVIYDSFIHSGSMPPYLMNRFPELKPAKGGDEKTWITQYVEVREDWLANHPNTILHNTVYRTDCFKREIARNNWDLSQLPIDAHDVDVNGN